MRVPPRRGLSPLPLAVPGNGSADAAAAPRGSPVLAAGPAAPRGQHGRGRDGWTDGRTDRGLRRGISPCAGCDGTVPGPGRMGGGGGGGALYPGGRVAGCSERWRDSSRAEVTRRRSLGFVTRAFPLLLPDSEAGVRCHFFPGSAPFFSAYSGSVTGGSRSPDEYFRCLKGEAESWPLPRLGGQPRWLSVAWGWDEGSLHSCAPRGMQSRGCAREPWLQGGHGHSGWRAAWGGMEGGRQGSGAAMREVAGTDPRPSQMGR